MSLDHRIHAPADSRPRPGGEFVLYWMQTTHRAHDNFALNFAVERANELGLPVQVYHGLRHDYPWASDRFHTWILEAVVDLYAAFEAKGINYAFWLSRGRGQFAEWPAGGKGGKGGQGGQGGKGDLDGWSPLVALARRAALVVTDYFPTFIVPRQTAGLRRKVETPVIAVDSATLVPMAWHTREHSTARGIRRVLMDALPHYLWPVENPEPRVRRSIELPFEPVVPGGTGETVGTVGAGGTVETVGTVGTVGTVRRSYGPPGRRSARAPIPELVASCDIDHSVPPSPMFRGGTVAGRARLDEWLREGLPRYAEARNDPNDPEAVSRLSPWLHFGNLSIHEVLLAAREAGPEAQYARFLDEALTWRELAHNFCHFNPKHRTVAGIPGWAREQLARHESDPRPRIYSLEELEQARTDDELWNACQRAYLRDGWMHNYLRMLWGKAALMWTRNARECLGILEHLNNKYSLDGRDPNSYGGIMWIFGKFDRPFYPRPIWGNVRYMSLKAAQGKFDVRRLVERSEK